MMTYRSVGGLAIAAILLGTVSGCASSARQRADIVRWEAEAAELGHPEVKYRQTRDPQTALELSFLPFGIAGFYVHRPGLGVTGILFWPLSIAWTAPQAPSSARNYDYQQFRREVAQLREEARELAPRQPAVDTATRLQRLEQLWKEGKISDREYQESRQKVLQGVAQ